MKLAPMFPTSHRSATDTKQETLVVGTLSANVPPRPHQVPTPENRGGIDLARLAIAPPTPSEDPRDPAQLRDRAFHSARRAIMSTELQEQCAKLEDRGIRRRFTGLPVRVYFPRNVDDGAPEQFAPRLPDRRHGVPAARSRVFVGRSRMVVAKKAATAGHLLRPRLKTCAMRFHAVHDWAVEHLGEAHCSPLVRHSVRATTKRPLPEEFDRQRTGGANPSKPSPKSNASPARSNW